MLRAGPTPELAIDIRLPLDRFELVVELATREAVTGIFGASGAGKTSLLEIVAGLRRRATGSVSFGGEVWLDSGAGVFVPPERRHIGYVPQDGLLFPHRSVRQNLLAGARRARRGGGRPEETLGSVAALLELEPLLGREVTTLSGGERQRVALGRALCSGPRLLLLDEPLASLDLPLRRRLLPLLRRVRAELTIPMLLVSHDPIEVQALCDELMVLRQGQPVARGEPPVVLTDPEIFALAEREGFENVLPGRLAGRRGGSAVVRLGGDGGPELVAAHGEGREGEEVLVGVPASEILLATRAPEAISARNVLPGWVVEMGSAGGFELVKVQLAGAVPPLAVEITEAVPAELGLAPGKRIFLVIKAASCRVYGGGAGEGTEP